MKIHEPVSVFHVLTILILIYLRCQIILTTEPSDYEFYYTIFIVVSGGLDALLCGMICYVINKNDSIVINITEDGTVAVKVVEYLSSDSESEPDNLFDDDCDTKSDDSESEHL